MSHAKWKLALAALIGIATGVACATTMGARSVETPPGYVIAEVAVTDRAAIQKYAARVPETLAPFNHRLLIRGGRTTSLEGDPPRSIVVMAFDSVEKAQAWYDSPAYAAIRPIRQSGAKSRLYIVEGVTAAR